MSRLGKQLGLAAAIVLVAAAIGLTVNWARPEGLPIVQDWQAALEERAREQAGGVEIIDYRRMVEEYRVEGTVVVDARSEDFYTFEHIPGARNLPLAKADDMISGFLAGLPEGTRLIVYCDGPSCPAARELGAKLNKAGHKDVAVYLGGMEEWSMEGGPVAEGEQG